MSYVEITNKPYRECDPTLNEQLEDSITQQISLNYPLVTENNLNLFKKGTLPYCSVERNSVLLYPMLAALFHRAQNRKDVVLSSHALKHEDTTSVAQTLMKSVYSNTLSISRASVVFDEKHMFPDIRYEVSTQTLVTEKYPEPLILANTMIRRPIKEQIRALRRIIVDCGSVSTMMTAIFLGLNPDILFNEVFNTTPSGNHDNIPMVKMERFMYIEADNIINPPKPKNTPKSNTYDHNAFDTVKEIFCKKNWAHPGDFICIPVQKRATAFALLPSAMETAYTIASSKLIKLPTYQDILENPYGSRILSSIITMYYRVDNTSYKVLPHPLERPHTPKPQRDLEETEITRILSTWDKLSLPPLEEPIPEEELAKLS